MGKVDREGAGGRGSTWTEGVLVDWVQMVREEETSKGVEVDGSRRAGTSEGTLVDADGAVMVSGGGGESESGM